MDVDGSNRRKRLRMVVHDDSEDEDQKPTYTGQHESWTRLCSLFPQKAFATEPVYKVAFSILESYIEPIPAITELFGKLDWCGLVYDTELVSLLYENFTTLFTTQSIQPTLSSLQTASHPPGLQLSDNDRNAFDKDWTVTANAASAVRAYWSSFASRVDFASEGKIHPQAKCWMKNYISNDKWWAHQESVFMKLEILSFLNGGACITVNAKAALDIKYYVGFNCYTCPTQHKLSFSVHKLAWLVQFGRPTIQQMSDILHSSMDGSHLCGVFFCRVATHKVLESGKLNDGRMTCHFKIDANQEPNCPHAVACLSNRSKAVFEAQGLGLGTRDIEKTAKELVVVKIGDTFKDAVEKAKESRLGAHLGHGIDLAHLTKQNLDFMKRLIGRVESMETALKNASDLHDPQFWKSQPMRVYPMMLIEKSHRPSGEWAEFRAAHQTVSRPGFAKLLSDLENWNPYRCLECDFACASKSGLRAHIEETH